MIEVRHTGGRDPLEFEVSSAKERATRITTSRARCRCRHRWWSGSRARRRANPFDGVDVGTLAAPSFADLDGAATSTSSGSSSAPCTIFATPPRISPRRISRSRPAPPMPTFRSPDEQRK